MLCKREIIDPALGLPFRKAAVKITLGARGRLIALLGGFCEQLHDDCGNGDWNLRQPIARRHRLARDVAMNQFHRIGRREWQGPGNHLVEHDAQ